MSSGEETHVLDEVLRPRLEALARTHLFRHLRSVSGPQGAWVGLDGKHVLSLSSNNYLGLADDPVVKQAAAHAVECYGCGAGASRLVSGSMELHEALEQELAAFKHTEAALLFNTGYHANIGVIPAVANGRDAIFSDERNHASIVDGCRLSRATVHVFRHRDIAHLEELLARAGGASQRLIITESVFSMDGDVAPLDQIVDVARMHRACVMVDEAHAMGVFGSRGGGVVEQMGLEGQVEIQMGTLSKALGSLGAYVATTQVVTNWLVNRARSFIYTTALPPPVLASARAALAIVVSEPARRDRLWANAALLNEGLRQLGYHVAPTESPIIPVLIGDAEQTMSLGAALLERGVFVQGIRPPTVPRGTARLRVTPMATHTVEDLERALQAFGSAGKAVGVL